MCPTLKCNGDVQSHDELIAFMRLTPATRVSRNELLGAQLLNVSRSHACCFFLHPD